jgi:hypothetical protein
VANQPNKPPEETPMQRLKRLTKDILQVPKEAIREPKREPKRDKG